MNTNLIKREFRRDLKVFLVVALALTGFLAITLSMYASMKDSMLAVTELYANMSQGIKDALNFQDGQWNHILGFYATYFVYYVPMMGGAYSIYLGSSILAREEHQKTAEFLLAKPITRNEIVSSKIVVLVTYITGFNLLLWLNGFLWSGFISGFDETFIQITILHTYGWFICLFFGFLGLFISVMMKRARSIIGPGIGLVLILYMLDMILRITDKADFILYFTPYKYMNIDLLSPDYRMEWWRLGVLALSIGMLSTLSFLFYRRKDILL